MPLGDATLTDSLADEREEAHSELAKERWTAHRELHAGEKELAAQKWEGHEDQHESIARNLSEYKSQSNEWRGSLSDLRATFATAARVDGLEASMEHRLDELRASIATEREERRDQQNLRTGQEEGISRTTAIILALIAAVGAVLGGIAVVVNLLK